MDKSPCKLTLVYPLTAEDRIVELMLETTPPIGGFTTMRAEGHGHDFAEASVNERVRGRVRRGSGGDGRASRLAEDPSRTHPPGRDGPRGGGLPAAGSLPPVFPPRIAELRA